MVTGSRILIVEDTPDIMLLYTRLLRGAELIQVGTGTEACKRLQVETFDMMILDMHIGDTPGLEVLCRARSMDQHAHTPIVVISADDSLRTPARESGCNAWLSKPFEIDAFLDMIDAVLPQPALI